MTKQYQAVPCPEADPRCPWCGENHPTEALMLGEIKVTSCPRAGCDDSSWRREYLCKFPEPVAQVRLEDGSQVVAFQPAGLEVRAFGADDLDERGLPRGMP